ncbi:MAG TPA: Ig-like domain-containing protein [Myxococcota bacterium]|nr:Ig-like domain-containing protein [Myxococcota bacterium]
MRALRREGLILFFTLAGLALCQTARAGQGLSILPPPGCIPADGGQAFDIYVYVWGRSGPGELALMAESGSFGKVHKIGGGLFSAAYDPVKLASSSKTVLRAMWKETGSEATNRTIVGTREVRLCPLPVGKVEARAQPERLLAGEGQQAFLHIRVSDSAGRPAAGLPLEITTNVGRVKNFSDLGDGSYEVVFLPPGDPYPQVAIIMVANPVSARLDRVAVARAVIPITARIELPGKTAPGTKMEMTVAGRRFGPARADENGNFKIPILVPPGYDKGLAMSVDRVGNRRSRRVSLYLPETNQLGLWAYPRKLPSDGRSRARLLVTTIDPYGAPTSIGGVRILAEHGRVSKIEKIGKGLYEAFYTAPTEVGGGKDLVGVHFPTGGHKSTAAVEMSLLPGQIAGVSLEAPRFMPADGKTTGEVIVKVRDARGNPVAGKAVTIRAEVAKIPALVESAPGLHRAVFTVPTGPRAWTDRLKVEVRETPGGEPAGLLVAHDSLRVSGNGGLVLHAALVDGLGRPVAGQSVRLEGLASDLVEKSDEFGLLKFSLGSVPVGEGPIPLKLEGAGGRISRPVYILHGKNGARLLPVDLDDALPPDKPYTSQSELQIYPPAPLELRLETKQQGRLWIVSAGLVPEAAAKDSGAQVVFAASAGKLTKVRKISPALFEVTLDPGQSGWRSIFVTATEAESHIGAVREIVEGGQGP